MDERLSSPLDWIEVLEPGRPRTEGYPGWRAPEPRHYRTEDGAVDLWVGGSGSFREPFVLELSAEGRYPTVEEIRSAALAFTLPGAVFGLAGAYLVALPQEEIPPVLLVQIAGTQGSEAETRLRLSGAPPTPAPGAEGPHVHRQG